MNQQYVLLKKENDPLKSLIGRSFNQKSKFEAQKILEEIHSKAESRMIGKKALCYVVDENEILGLGGSTMLKDKTGKIISNLVLNQFGKWLNAFLDPEISNADREVTLVDTSGVSQTMRTYNSRVSKFNNQAGTTLGTLLQVGAGTTAPTRADFKIETAFASAPENSPFGTTPSPNYSASTGIITRSSVVIAGGSGTVNESGLQVDWIKLAGTETKFLLFHDSISPGVPFVAAQTIALEYQIQM